MTKPLSAKLYQALLERYSNSVIEKDMEVIVARIKTDPPTSASVSLEGIRQATIDALLQEGWKVAKGALIFPAEMAPSDPKLVAPEPEPKNAVVFEMKRPLERNDTFTAEDTQKEIEDLQANIKQLHRKKDATDSPEEIASYEREISMALKALTALKKLTART
jgi:hypothetical protein